MPYISNETLFGAALIIVLAFGYQFLPSGPSSTNQAHELNNNQSKSSKKKNKKKNTKAGPSKGHRESDGIALGKQPEHSKNESIASDHTNKGISLVNGIKHNKEADQAALGNTTPTLKEENGSGNSINKKQKKKLLAEKLLPKEPKTKVDDMLAPEDRPGQIARVMKVTSSSSKPNQPTTNSIHLAAPVIEDTETSEEDEEVTTSGVENGAGSEQENGKLAKFQDDYVDLSENENENDRPKNIKKKDNDGWDVVTSKKKKSSTINISSDPFSSNSTSTSLPLPPGAASRQQKKNAKKAEGKKLAREAEEVERQRRLNLHRKDLERERINELYASKQSNPNRGKSLGGGGSSGSKATLTENGKLVWD
ncbi:uncharacterized protein L201_002600 [Kwoniella dendrophila CBS 6074]|uniref:INO80 complex subunit B-like conserved region domain-containing protein n=1 Tax=Kwoniella dendrophila CBS 6074 TaxID=1295534 RepID=A0AAX4JS31_9TREE